METEKSVARKLISTVQFFFLLSLFRKFSTILLINFVYACKFQLVSSSVQRSHLSGALCRLTILLKFIHNSNPKSLQISVSDTGVGTNLVEIKELDVSFLAHSNKWDGELSITTTGLNDTEIRHYLLNSKENLSSKTRLKRMPSTAKQARLFSGTEICTSTLEEETSEELTAWVVNFVQKMLILKDQNVSAELIVENMDSQGSRRSHLIQQNFDIHQDANKTKINLLISGLKNYVLKHGNTMVDKYQACTAKEEHLKIGIGQASSAENIRGTGQIVEVGMVIATASLEPCCWRANSSVTQILYFENFSPASISNISLSGLASVDWQNYGLKLKKNFVDNDGHAVLEWENMPLFAHFDIAIHCYDKLMEPTPCHSYTIQRNLVKKAVKNALDDLKAKHTNLFLSSHASKVRDYAPDLSRTIAGLITSSNDPDFRDECAALLGLQTCEASEVAMVESCIQEKIVRVIEMNDTKAKGDRGNSSSPLFECEAMHGEEACLDDDGGGGVDYDSDVMQF